MRSLFGALIFAGALAAQSAYASCAHPEDHSAVMRDSWQRDVLASALSCGNVALSSRAVFYRAGEPQRANAAFFALVYLLRSQQMDGAQRK